MQQPTKNPTAPRAPPPVWQDLIAGTCGGIAGIIVSFPFDTIKVRLQTQPYPPIYKGMIDCASQMIKTEGVSFFYKGMLAPVIGAAAIKSTLFAARRLIKTLLLSYHTHSNPNLSLLELTFTSCAAGLIATVIVTPVERIKVSLQAQRQSALKTIGSFQCAVTLVKEQGIIQGLFRGFTATALREVPSYGLYFMTYEFGRYLLGMEDGKALGGLASAMIGAACGIACWIPVYPIDVVKSRIQASSGKEYSGMWDCCVKSYREAGWKVFWRGLTPTLVRAVPCHSAVFVGYEFVMGFFETK